MSSELNASIRLNLTGNLTEKSRAYQREMKGMARQTRLSFQIMNRASKQAMKGISSGLDSMTSSYAAFAASVAGGISFRNAVSLERRMNRIGVQAEISTEKVKELQDEIFTTAMNPNIAIDPSELISSIEEIVTRTGDLDYARRNIEALAQTIQATGGLGVDIGGLVAELQKLNVDNVARGMNILVAQGKAGAVEAKDLAKLGPRILAAYAGTTKRQGESALAELGASMQVLQQATGNPEAAATTLEALLRDLQSPDKMRKLAMVGIDINEKDANGKTVMRDLPAIMTDIVNKLNGDMSRIGMIFGDEARRGFNNITAELIHQERVESFEKFANISVNFNQIAEDSKRIASDTAGGLQRLSTSWNYFITNQLDEPLNDLADTLHSVSDETIQSAYHIGKWVAAVGGSVLLLRKIGAFKGAAWLYRTLRNRRNGGGMGAAAGMSAMNVQPVYVVNMPGSGFGGAGMGRGGRANPRLGTSSPYLLGGPDAIDADFDDVPSRRSRWSRMRNSRFGRFGRRLAGPGGGRLLGFAGTGLMLADVAMNGGDASDIGAAAGSGLGGWGGAQLGAMIGSAIVPGLGTAIGGVLGGLIGSVAGSYAGEAAGDAFRDSNSNVQEVHGEMVLSIEDNRIRTKEVRSNSPNFNFSAGAGSDPGYWGGY
ncbi:phage tail tape measure protein [Vibrio parahaemolyticus]|nr:phage tail tape measure protein [Vibrio parahaemolyticus]MCR9657265.1 phage tail tape measure protein [Vibrio parahaemolyticus]